MNRKCQKCNDKVGLFAYLFGLRICKDCDMKPINDLLKAQKEKIKLIRNENFKSLIGLTQSEIDLYGEAQFSTITELKKYCEKMLK